MVHPDTVIDLISLLALCDLCFIVQDIAVNPYLVDSYHFISFDRLTAMCCHC